MAKRYELSDESWAVVADLFTETHGRGRTQQAIPEFPVSTEPGGCAQHYPSSRYSARMRAHFDFDDRSNAWSE